MTSDGTAWRPLVHVLDIAQAIAEVLAAPCETVSNEVFNVGDEANNYTVREISGAVSTTFPHCLVEFGRNSRDNRSYRVGFDKIRERLPNFRCRWSAADGAQQLSYGIAATLLTQVALAVAAQGRALAILLDQYTAQARRAAGCIEPRHAGIEHRLQLSQPPQLS